MITNISKPSGGITWVDIATTWATETKDWLSISQLLTNVARPI